MRVGISASLNACVSCKLIKVDLERFGVVDAIIEEPVGGAHRAPEETIESTASAISAAFAEMDGMNPSEIQSHRREKYLAVGRLV